MYEGTDPKPRGVEEIYQAATDTSNLAVDPDNRCPADVLIAAGWSESRLGMALLRLHSEWNSVRPRPYTDQQVIDHAATLPLRKGKTDMKRARDEMRDAFISVVQERAARLRGREEIEAQLRIWGQGIDPDIIAPTLTHWLAPKCPACLGRGKRRHPDAPVLAGECTSCHGSGERPRPLSCGQLYGYIEDALNKGRQSLKKRLLSGD